MTMPHALVIALELAGAVCILAGSSVLAVIAFVDRRWGFLLLEGVWPIVSAVSLIDVLRSGGQEGVGRPARR